MAERDLKSFRDEIVLYVGVIYVNKEHINKNK